MIARVVLSLALAATTAALVAPVAGAAEQQSFYGLASATYVDEAEHAATYRRVREEARTDAYRAKAEHETTTGETCMVTGFGDAETVEPRTAPPGTTRTLYVDYRLDTDCVSGA